MLTDKYRQPGASLAGRRMWDAGKAKEALAISRMRETLNRDREEAILGGVSDAVTEILPASEPVVAPSGTRMTVLIAEAARLFRVSLSDIRSERRDKRSVRARQWVMQKARDETELSLPQIGRALGHRHHTTVMNAVTPEARQRVKDCLEAIARGETHRGRKQIPSAEKRALEHAAAIIVTCPVCQAQVGERCLGVRKQFRESPHHERSIVARITARKAAAAFMSGRGG